MVLLIIYLYIYLFIPKLSITSLFITAEHYQKFWEFQRCHERLLVGKGIFQFWKWMIFTEMKIAKKIFYIFLLKNEEIRSYRMPIQEIVSPEKIICIVVLNLYIKQLIHRNKLACLQNLFCYIRSRFLLNDFKVWILDC